MTIVVDTDERGARLVEANLYKLISVRRVDNISQVPSIARDLAMIKVAAIGDARTQVMQLVDVYRARIVDISPESLVIETTGAEDKIDSLLEVLRPTGSPKWCARDGSRWCGAAALRAPRGKGLGRRPRRSRCERHVGVGTDARQLTVNSSQLTVTGATSAGTPLDEDAVVLAVNVLLSSLTVNCQLLTTV